MCAYVRVCGYVVLHFVYAGADVPVDDTYHLRTVCYSPVHYIIALTPSLGAQGQPNAAEQRASPRLQAFKVRCRVKAMLCSLLLH